MATTLLAKKADGENPIATNDDHHAALASDPTVTQFPAGSTQVTTTPATPATPAAAGGFGGTCNAATSTTGSTSGSSAFGAPSSGGFGSSSSFGSSTPSSGFGSSSSGGGFGSSSGGFGSSSGGFGSTNVNNMGSTGTSNMNMSMSNAPVLTGAGANAAQDGETLIANTNTDWVNNKWRPMMGWMYMLVCTMDFVVFPILWSLLQAMSHGQVTSQWQPVTLQGAGLFHMAMGAVLGVAAYGRTKEKVAGAA
jgi:hypothetical protein